MIERKLLFLMNADQAEVFAGLVESANGGDGSAACRLGDMYREGLGGLRCSPKETFRWYARSAMAGDANGQNNLGACYEHGLGCIQSYVKAVKWYRLSAAQNLSTASMNLGYCHLRGHGVPADKGEALRLFRLAVERGEDKAAAELERLGEPVRENTVSKKKNIRIVYETQPGKHLGLVGVGGIAPPEPKDAPAEDLPSTWTPEDHHRASLGAWEKDDCFDLPDPDSAYGKSLAAQWDLMEDSLIRRGLLPPRKVEVTEEDRVTISAECGIEPEELMRTGR